MISIIIPTYNRSDLILETLNSIKSQSYTNWECIIVDDGSDDGTDLLLTKFVKKNKKFKYFKRPKNLLKGANSCRNFGFKKAKGKYIQWFDSDDIMLVDFLKTKVEFFEYNPLINYNICGFTLFDLEGDLKEYLPQQSNNIVKSYAKGILRLNTPAIIFKRSLVETYSFNEALSRAQDLDFLFRVLINKKAVGGVVKESLVKIRIHANSISASYSKYKKIDLESSLFVCGNIYNYFKQNNDIEGVNLAAQDYLNTLKDALQNKQYLFFFKRSVFNNILNLVTKNKLIWLGVIYIMFGKGLTRIKHLI